FFFKVDSMDPKTLDKLETFVYRQCELSSLRKQVRVEFEGVKGILTVGLPRKEHNRSAVVAENTVRDQLWEGGKFCFGHWGQSKDGMQCRGSEGVDLTIDGYFTRKGPDGSIWIDGLLQEAPLFVIEVALSDPYATGLDKCRTWLTKKDGLIKFAILINIEKWKRKEEKAVAISGSNKRKGPPDERSQSNMPKRAKSEGSSAANIEPEIYEVEETDIEDLEEVEEKPGEPTPLTHKYKRATVSVFKSVRSAKSRQRVIETVINQMEIWPQHPTQTWKFTWRDIGNTVPESHINNVMETHFEELRTFMQQEFARAPPPFHEDDLSYIIKPDSPAS
ncbi:hypothetical protein K440DRAFT_620546, partial [Wilcoxina mikolae CBS 423.85]